MRTHRKLKPLAALLMSFPLTACGMGTFATDSACKSFKTISASVQDTPQTKRQVIGHNRAYDAICKG